ncbi:MAG: MltA domain-containing protein [Nitrosomonadales bacterium]|nr:MltA domain-containing protein [Nitrosomonadales bacterium]
MFGIDKKWLAWAWCLLLAACVTPPSPPVIAPPPAAPFAASNWDALPDWKSRALIPSWPAFLQSCHALKHKTLWQPPCARAVQLEPTDEAALHAYFEEWFTPWQVSNDDGSTQGLITGYYEPKLYGSREKSERFRYPLYAVPDDMLTIELGEVYPQLKDMRLRGRLQGKRVLPYYSRAEIDAGAGALQGSELFWVDDAVELFFLQIQGSGRIELPDGSLVKVGYADQNGYPYVSIGKKLVTSGELKLEEASMQGIKDWAGKNPDRLTALLEQNPSYVFFHELPGGLSAPPGALGVPLTDGYSIAVDARTIPLGAPVFLATTQPNSTEPLNRLMLAQDTGGAIRGAVRADFFWGFGEAAGAQAGRMKQQGRMWVLFPKGGEPARKY